MRPSLRLLAQHTLQGRDCEESDCRRVLTELSYVNTTRINYAILGHIIHCIIPYSDISYVNTTRINWVADRQRSLAQQQSIGVVHGGRAFRALDGHFADSSRSQSQHIQT